jgi:hypothetical protein
MPNWCNNSITVKGDIESIDKFQKFLDDKSGKEWFDFILPCPEELKNVGNVSFHDKRNEELMAKYGYQDWYSWSLDKWGCKWNCDAQDWDRDEDTITFWFDSPWGPPIALYAEMENQGYEVEAYYHEEGMAFVGKFSYGSDENYEYSDLESLDDIPEELVEYWGIRDRMLDDAEWNEENDWSDDEPEVFTSDESKEWIKGLLKDGVVEVTFIKSDGTERVMKCTLKDEVISEHWVAKSTETQKKISEDALPVFDVEAKGWRSFRFDSIKEVNFSLE